jgi:outer membrane receptor for monomeric catechols
VNIDRDQTDIPAGGAAVFLPQNARNELTKAAIYAQDEWKFQKNSSLYLGLRWSRWALPVKGLRNRNPTTTPVF